jgi:sulfur dioxygenase
MIFRQLFDPVSSTYSYLLADEPTRQAVLIDSVYERFARDAALLDELGLRLIWTLETHVHADHVTAAWLLRERFGSKIAISRAALNADLPTKACADRLLDPGDQVAFGAHTLEVRATPGHTNGCVTFVLDDRTMAFTGDALLVRGAGRTDFQEGDARTLYRSVHTQIFSLPDTTLLYPAHDYAGRMVTSVAEEKRHNPRLGAERSEDDFVGLMQNLRLPHPKQIDIAVPANLRCGRPQQGAEPKPTPWAPVVRTYAGVPEITSEWLHEHAAGVRLIDVRQPQEWSGELGHIEGAELIPLSALLDQLSSLNKSDAIVLVCRSGGRSAQAAQQLESAGFARVANLSGGMIAWRGARLPVVAGDEA